ncbi:MAG: mechanosensitive ion channel family protein [Calditrichaeota bacterium]|nr:MAG: mechanosensitive ion channel family protein [Calditrichota bacterium]
MPDIQSYITYVVDLAVKYAPKLATALVVLFVGLWIVRVIAKGFVKATNKTEMDKSLQKFLSSLLNMGLKAMLIISVIQMVGIETTSFVAVLGAAGLAVGLALQGSLANFAGGVLILIFKPFKVGEYIEGAGVSGTVDAIEVLATTLKTPDNKVIFVPNGALAGSTIVNYSREATRRVDFTFGIGYNDDLQKARQVLMRLIEKDTRILKDPAPFVAVGNLGDSTVDFTVRVWVNAPDYWAVYFDMTERVKETFDAEGISIPYPQMDVHQFKGE